MSQDHPVGHQYSNQVKKSSLFQPVCIAFSLFNMIIHFIVFSEKLKSESLDRRTLWFTTLNAFCTSKMYMSYKPTWLSSLDLICSMRSQLAFSVEWCFLNLNCVGWNETYPMSRKHHKLLCFHFFYYLRNYWNNTYWPIICHIIFTSLE